MYRGNSIGTPFFFTTDNQTNDEEVPFAESPFITGDANVNIIRPIPLGTNQSFQSTWTGTDPITTLTRIGLGVPISILRPQKGLRVGVEINISGAIALGGPGVKIGAFFGQLAAAVDTELEATTLYGMPIHLPVQPTIMDNSTEMQHFAVKEQVTVTLPAADAGEIDANQLYAIGIFLYNTTSGSINLDGWELQFAARQLTDDQPRGYADAAR